MRSSLLCRSLSTCCSCSSGSFSSFFSFSFHHHSNVCHYPQTQGFHSIQMCTKKIGRKKTTRWFRGILLQTVTLPGWKVLQTKDPPTPGSLSGHSLHTSTRRTESELTRTGRELRSERRLDPRSSLQLQLVAENILPTRWQKCSTKSCEWGELSEGKRENSNKHLNIKQLGVPSHNALVLHAIFTQTFQPIHKVQHCGPVDRVTHLTFVVN